MGEGAFVAERVMDILTQNDRLGQYPKSYYADTVKCLPPFATLHSDLSCDVCVVGGGYTGLSTALSLAEKGYGVILLEAQRVVFGASGRNGGQVCSGQRWSVSDLKKRFGPAKANILWKLGEAAKKEVRERIRIHKISCDYAPGIIHAELKKRALSAVRLEVEQLNKDHNYEEIQFLDKTAIETFLGTDKYVGGSLDMGAGHLNPLKFGLGLAKAAHLSGVKIFENSRVRKINKGSTVTIETVDDKVIKAKFLVLGCNGYLGKLDSEIASHIMPINNFINVTEPLGKELAESLIQHNLAVSDSKFVVNYFRLTPDHRLLFGGGENYRYTFPNNFSRTVRKAMIDIYPQLSRTKIAYSWGGTLAVTMNRLPDFRKISSNIFSASGYSGQGVALATLAGRILSEVIQGNSEKFDILSELPSQKFPGGTLFRWPLMALAMLWYSSRDKI